MSSGDSSIWDLHFSRITKCTWRNLQQQGTYGSFRMVEIIQISFLSPLLMLRGFCRHFKYPSSLREGKGGLGPSASATGIINFNFGMSARRHIGSAQLLVQWWGCLATDQGSTHRGGVFDIIGYLALQVQRATGSLYAQRTLLARPDIQ